MLVDVGGGYDGGEAEEEGEDVEEADDGVACAEHDGGLGCVSVCESELGMEVFYRCMREGMETVGVGFECL